MPESVTHVPGLICYLCTWTIPSRRLTSACTRARNLALYVSTNVACGPGDAKRSAFEKFAVQKEEV